MKWGEIIICISLVFEGMERVNANYITHSKRVINVIGLQHFKKEFRVSKRIYTYIFLNPEVDRIHTQTRHLPFRISNNFLGTVTFNLLFQTTKARRFSTAFPGLWVVFLRLFPS